MPRRTQMTRCFPACWCCFWVCFTCSTGRGRRHAAVAAVNGNFVPLPRGKSRPAPGSARPAEKVPLRRLSPQYFQCRASRRLLPAAHGSWLAAKPAAPRRLRASSAGCAGYFLWLCHRRAHRNRRAFFNDGDDVYVIGVGETLLGRFRLMQIGNNTAEMEEVATGRTATLTMTEEPGPSMMAGAFAVRASAVARAEAAMLC